MALSGENIALFCAEEPMRRMLAALCARHPGRLVIADGEDAALLSEAAAFARESRLPLLLLACDPDRVPLPEGVQVYCLPRPFAFGDFYAALDALTGRQPPPAPEEKPEPPPAPALHWDRARRTVRCGEESVVLTEREADVFDALYAASPGIVSAETIGADFERTAGNGAQVYITYLRRKLAPLPLSVTIASHRGRGYSLLIAPRTEDKI